MAVGKIDMQRLAITVTVAVISVFGTTAEAQQSRTSHRGSEKGTKTSIVQMPDYDKPICAEFPNYRLIRTNGAEVVICRANLRKHTKPIVVDGNVQRLAVKAPFVTGYITILYGDEHPSNKEGYFILDLKTGEQKASLTEQEWRSELKRVGWAAAKLSSPPMLSED
jgi:hypothetical protein